VVAQSLGLLPALGSTDTALVNAGDGYRLALVYLISPDTNLIQFTSGETTIDLTPAFGQSAQITDLGDTPEPPELMEVTVVQVLDGHSIMVENEDGARTRVRYLGVQAPMGNACYARESEAANKAMVDGQTVYLERERKNRAPNSRISRDVWIAGPDGELTLVAAELAAEGAVAAVPVEPDIRFAGWIEAADAAAQFFGYGLWGACGGLEVPLTATEVAGSAVAPAAQIIQPLQRRSVFD
jgi:endonuclease YncB( thermonuclease family)